MGINMGQEKKGQCFFNSAFSKDQCRWMPKYAVLTMLLGRVSMERDKSFFFYLAVVCSPYPLHAHVRTHVSRTHTSRRQRASQQCVVRAHELNQGEAKDAKTGQQDSIWKKAASGETGIVLRSYVWEERTVLWGDTSANRSAYYTEKTKYIHANAD